MRYELYFDSNETSKILVFRIVLNLLKLVKYLAVI